MSFEIRASPARSRKRPPCRPPTRCLLQTPPRGPSLFDQGHRAAAINSRCAPPWAPSPSKSSPGNFTAATGLDNDRPVVDARSLPKPAFRSTLLRCLEAFNLFNHGNFLGCGQTVYGDAVAPAPTFGQLVPVGTTPNAIPAFANFDLPRMFQFQLRWLF